MLDITIRLGRSGIGTKIGGGRSGQNELKYLPQQEEVEGAGLE